MTLSLAAQRRTCERQLERLRSSHLERHDLLDVATTLMLLMGSLDADGTDDVAGHQLRKGHNAGADVAADSRVDLAWIQSQGRTASLDELRDRTQRAARELCRQLSLAWSNEPKD
ncbi:MAG TPA: hypothetical protein VIO57_07620 [Chloroflexota bacterium]